MSFSSINKNRLTCLLILSTIAFVASGYDFMIDDIAYSINSDGESVSVTYTSTIYNYNHLKPPYEIEVPNVVAYGEKVYNVTAIAPHAFAGAEIYSIYMWGGVTKIGDGAFKNSKITNCSLSASLVTLGDSVFYASTLPIITIPDNVESVGKSTFENSGLTSATLGKKVSSISTNMFKGCLQLNEFVIPSSVTAIENNAFRGSGITSIEIPNTVLTISSGAFENCKSLVSASIDCPTIVSHLFKGCNKLSHITIEKSVRTIQTNAFNGTSIQEINLPASLEQVEEGACRACHNLLRADINCSVVPKNLFGGNTKLAQIILGDNVRDIKSGAFSGLSALTHIDIPASVEIIETGAFDSQLIKTVTVACANSHYDSRDNCNAIIETSNNSLVFGCANTSIPSSIVAIGDSAFAGCTDLSWIIIPECVEAIGNEAFTHCGELTVCMGPNISEIGEAVFSQCEVSSLFVYGNIQQKGTAPFKNSHIRNLHIMRNVNDLTNVCFEGLETIYSYNNNPPECSLSTFNDYSIPLHVPHDATASYFTHAVWGKFFDLDNDAPQSPLQVNCDTISLCVNETMTIPVRVPDLPQIVEWESSDNTVATVTDGNVTALSIGEATIKVTWLHEQVLCHVVVTPSPAETIITLDKHSLKMNINDVETIIPTITPEKVTITAESDNPAVATARIVDDIVRVYALTPGKAIITVSSLDREAQPDYCEILVLGTFKKGDVNGDGVVSGSDVSALYNVLLNNTEVMGEPDVNSDGIVNGTDITLLYNILLEQ